MTHPQIFVLSTKDTLTVFVRIIMEALVSSDMDNIMILLLQNLNRLIVLWLLVYIIVSIFGLKLSNDHKMTTPTKQTQSLEVMLCH
jgi:hypothetical protein